MRLPPLPRSLRRLSAGLLAPLALAAAAPSAPPTAPAPRPHLVYILADDMGYNDCGFRGGKDIPTPHLDRLAATGTVLDAFYAQPVCSPTRASLMTGRYPFRYGLQTGVIRPYAHYGLSLDERMLPAVLRDAGYDTAIVGKWHLGHFAAPYLPTARGFVHQYGHYNGALDYFTHERDGGHDWHRDDRPNYDEGYTTRLVARESVRLIHERDRTKPLFLYVPFNAVHGPLEAPADTLATVTTLTGQRRLYAAMLIELDRAVGQIVAALEAEKILGETLLVFSSDNGGPRPGVVTDNTPLRAGKGTLYEGGVRVAAFATWPGHIPPGTTVHAPLHMVDWFPTFLGLAGAPLAQPLPLDGRDILACLTADAPSPHDVVVFNVTPRNGALREGNWKLVLNGQFAETEEEPGADPAAPKAAKKKNKAAPPVAGTAADTPAERLELFDLATDLREKNNVAAAHPDIVARLRARLAEFSAVAAKPLAAPGDNRGTAPKIWGPAQP